MSLFGQVTHVKLKDCFEDQHKLLTFVVEDHDLGRAIGKHAMHVKKLEYLLKRIVRILGFNSDVYRFLEQVISPLRVQAVREDPELRTEEGPVFIIEGGDIKTKSLLIGRNAQNLRNTEAIIRRYFPLKELKVV